MTWRAAPRSDSPGNGATRRRGCHAVHRSFDEALAACRHARDATLELADSLTEEALDRPAAIVPAGFEDTFGSYRLCLQYAADHWYMHRGHLADARRAARIDRMWL